MKLRNKKTGKVVSAECVTIFNPYDEFESCNALDEFYTLSELNEIYEDYPPAEPLIKDEKIRKAVRAWADANKFEADYEVRYYSNTCSLDSWQADIEFNAHIPGLKDEEKYTIAELCGEAEE